MVDMLDFGSRDDYLYKMKMTDEIQDTNELLHQFEFIPERLKDLVITLEQYFQSINFNDIEQYKAKIIKICNVVFLNNEERTRVIDQVNSLIHVNDMKVINSAITKMVEDYTRKIEDIAESITYYTFDVMDRKNSWFERSVSKRTLARLVDITSTQYIIIIIGEICPECGQRDELIINVYKNGGYQEEDVVASGYITIDYPLYELNDDAGDYTLEDSGGIDASDLKGIVDFLDDFLQKYEDIFEEFEDYIY